MTANTFKTLATAMVAQHSVVPFASKDEAVMWGYDICKSLNTANKAYTEAKLGAPAKPSHKVQAMAGLAALEPENGWTLDFVSETAKSLILTYGVAESTAKGYIKEHLETVGIAYPSSLNSDEVIDWVVRHRHDYRTYDTFKDALIERFKNDRCRSNINEYTKGLRMHFALLEV